MSRGSPKKPPPPSETTGQTTFQLYRPRSDLLDYTEHRLIRLARLSKSPDRQVAIRQLLQGYKSCSVRVAWKGGEPVFIDEPVATE